MKQKLAQFSTIVLFALVMGVFWGTWFALSRSIIAFRPQTFLDIGQTAIRNLAVPMRILMPLALLSALILLALLPKRSAVFAFAAAGFVLMVCALVVTRRLKSRSTTKSKCGRSQNSRPIGKRCVTAGSLITHCALSCRSAH
jgi:hypothetical protein